MPYVKIEVPENDCETCQLFRENYNNPVLVQCPFRKERAIRGDAKPTKACKEARIK